MSEIRYYNRYTGKEEVEEVYGESFLRWTYETVPGRTSLWAVARRAAFSRWYGWRMSRPASAAAVQPFIDKYGLKAEEFAESPSSYRTFNEFFYRKLKPGARPLSGVEASTAVLPADARHLAIGNLGEVEGIYAKGQRFDIAAFLADAELARRFEGGAAVISRLCPVDYHRFHAPVSGRIERQTLVNGWLYSVSPIALRRRIGYLWENKRILTVIESEAWGVVAFVAIGATCVGTIEMTAQSGEAIVRGDELGYFAFGGSCVVTLFEPGRIRLEDDLAESGTRQQEVYARVGDAMGRRP